MEDELIRLLLEWEEFSQSVIDRIHEGEALAREFQEILDLVEAELDNLDPEHKARLLEQLHELLETVCKVLSEISFVFASGEDHNLIDLLQQRMSAFSIQWSGDLQPQWPGEIERKLLRNTGLRLSPTEIEAYLTSIQETLSEAVCLDAQTRKRLAEQIDAFSQVACELNERFDAYVAPLKTPDLLRLTREIIAGLKDVCVILVDVAAPFKIPDPSLKVYYLAIRSAKSAGSSLIEKATALWRWVRGEKHKQASQDKVLEAHKLAKSVTESSSRIQAYHDEMERNRRSSRETAMLVGQEIHGIEDVLEAMHDIARYLSTNGNDPQRENVSDLLDEIESLYGKSQHHQHQIRERILSENRQKVRQILKGRELK